MVEWSASQEIDFFSRAATYKRASRAVKQHKSKIKFEFSICEQTFLQAIFLILGPSCPLQMRIFFTDMFMHEPASPPTTCCLRSRRRRKKSHCWCSLPLSKTNVEKYIAQHIFCTLHDNMVINIIFGIQCSTFCITSLFGKK